MSTSNHEQPRAPVSAVLLDVLRVAGFFATFTIILALVANLISSALQSQPGVGP